MNKVIVNSEMMAAKVATMTDVAAIRQLKANAEARGGWDVFKACVKQLAELGAPAETHPLVRRFWEIITASEELQGVRHSRVRQMFARRQTAGISAIETAKAILSKWAADKAPTQGFLKLIEFGVPELTGEAVVVEFTEEFSTHVVTAAKERLAAYGS
jgi:hypothetical protein